MKRPHLLRAWAVAACLLACGPAEPAEPPPSKAAADKAKVQRVMNVQEEVHRVCDEIEPLTQRLSAMEPLYRKTCGLKKLAKERSRIVSELSSRVDRLNTVLGEMKNVSRTDDIIATIAAKQGWKAPKSSPELYLERTVNSCIERFGRVKGAALSALSSEEAAFQAARKDCAARTRRLRWLAGALAAAALLAVIAWRFLSV
ncbi:MAG: hypothetical protein HY922_08240 [Elusimicrobia bacterium]|nr:hypothetical protein [Elusimicrobiota bacterium]